ncbi:unnamed protein product, partial [Symbiodinium necroappetens]
CSEHDLNSCLVQLGDGEKGIRTTPLSKVAGHLPSIGFGAQAFEDTPVLALPASGCIGLHLCSQARRFDQGSSLSSARRLWTRSEVMQNQYRHRIHSNHVKSQRWFPASRQHECAIYL